MNMKEYSDYLRSRQWKITRAKFLSNKKRRCEACWSKDALHVHHQTYETLGREQPSDLSLLCEDCHLEVHALEEFDRKLTLRKATQQVIEEHQNKIHEG